jgi:cysteine desulfurase
VAEPLYLDHAATSPPSAAARRAFDEASAAAWANPGSLHAAGATAARALERARRQLRDGLGARAYRVIWTGTGTEANHLGTQGLARALRPRAESAGRRAGGAATARVLVGAAEHASGLHSAMALAAEGFVVETIPVDAGGVVRPAALSPMLGPDVALVSVQWANNELGSLNPIAELVSATRAAAPHAAFHCDAVQAAGKRVEPLDLLGADSASIAAHKLGGVRGCAALLLRDGVIDPEPMFVGGGHEDGLRSGTENVMGAAAFAAAVAARAQLLGADPRALAARRAALLERLRAVAPDLVVLGPVAEAEQLGSILAVAVPGVRAETFLHIMEAEGVYVGSGSACHAHGARTSRVLRAVGLAEELHDSVLRLSLCGSESQADLERAAAAFGKAAAVFAG